jgi:hypothetical protein
MPIPRSITREHVLQAIEQLDRGVTHPFGPSVDYDLIYEGRKYPPKAVVGIAAELATGARLGPADFSAGEGPGQANAVLRDLGFQVERRIPLEPHAESPRVWLEMTHSNNQHGGPGWEFGTCLWSPSKNRTGQDYYRTMREPKLRDRVIHSLDSTIVGESTVAREHVERNDQPPSPGPWEGLAPYYRIELKDYRRFSRPYALSHLLREYGDRILDDIRTNRPTRYPFFITGAGGLHTVQGGYLTRCTPVLTAAIDEAVMARPATPIPTATPTRVPGARYWCMALGEGGRMWPECHAKGLAVLGWDELGDLKQYPEVRSLEERLAREREGDARPTNSALACWQFAHEMKTGDFILAKRGISEIMGLGEVTSGYEFLPDRQEYKNTRRVRWIASGHWELPANHRLPQKTLTDISTYTALLDYVLPLISRSPRQDSATLTLYTIDDALQGLFIARDSLVSMFNAFSRRKNLIIEGPPGVGKTFLARRLAYARIGYKDPTRVGAIQRISLMRTKISFRAGGRRKLAGLL